MTSTVVLPRRTQVDASILTDFPICLGRRYHKMLRESA
jgi:hypothetical protein